MDSKLPCSKSLTLNCLEKVSRFLNICIFAASCFLDSWSRANLFSMSIFLRASERSPSCLAFLSIVFFMSIVGRRCLSSWLLMVCEMHKDRIGVNCECDRRYKMQAFLSSHFCTKMRALFTYTMALWMCNYAAKYMGYMNEIRSFALAVNHYWAILKK